MGRIVAFISTINTQYQSVIRSLSAFISFRPITSFLIVLSFLFIAIFAGNNLRKPKPEPQSQPSAKQVSLYHVGEAPKIAVSAKVEKSGVVKIVASAPGIVQSIHVIEGDTVSRGTPLVNLASNYQGGNAAGIQRQLAQAAYQNAQAINQTQKDIIAKQRDVANNSLTNFEQLRQITQQSANDTQGQVNDTAAILATIDQTITNLEATNAIGSNNQLIASAKQLRYQFQGSLNQLQNSLRNTNYQANPSNAPTNLANDQKDLTVKQLDNQEKALSLGLETARLQVQLAQVTEAAMYPAAPFGGVIERVYVQNGQSVNPGTPLVLIHGNQDTKIIANVSANIAKQVSKTEPATVHIGNRTLTLKPDYVSTEATNNGQYAVIFTLPGNEQNNVSNASFLRIDLPIGYADTTKTVPFVPLDAIYQTQDKAYLFIALGGKATSREVKLGEVSGNFVQIINGLTGNETIITTRNVVAGDQVKE